MKKPILEIQTGWGLTPKSRGFSTSNIQEILELEAEQSTRGVIPSGLGRSYGDSSLNSGGYRINSNSHHELEIDSVNGIANCGSGVSIRDLEYEAHLKGFLPPVVPGTSYVTLGGAFASDIHGKSQQVDGNFSDHVTSISIIDRYGIERTFLPESEEFKATSGGMGLTGFISKLQIRLMKVDIPIIYQEEVRVKNLTEMLSVLEELEERHPYTVGWIDLSGNYLGRGLVGAGRFASATDIENLRTFDYGFEKDSRGFALPFLGRMNFARNPAVRVFNEIWFRKPLKSGLVKFSKFMHPLDSIANWNNIYGKEGFVQYQLVIPEKNRECLHEILALLKAQKITSFLTVLKKFGKNGSGYLSFPIPGWTLAMDFSAESRNLAKVIERLDELVIKFGGRVYLTKDSTSTPDSIRLMYPDLEKWKNVKKKMDPTNFWISDQSRRLEL
jgi:decaprenylphospho-beta-D-ribofuranose 2-oxidase